jgi:spoIIIJ-associated protein
MVRHLGANCTIDIRRGKEDGVVVVDVIGDDGGLLIGRRGQTLDAIDYLLNRMVHREAGPCRIVIDVEHYRERRDENLAALARRLADKARETGRVVTLNPMNPRDRRLIHLALRDEPSITTRSQGEGHYRKLDIIPEGISRRRSNSATRGDTG